MELNNPLLDWTSFGLWLDECKGAMSNRELGRRVGLSPSQIGNILAATSKTKIEMVGALARAVGKTEREAFMILGAEKPTMSQEEVELISTYRSVPEEERHRFLSVVKATGQVFAVPN